MKLNSKQEQALINLLWECMKKDKEYRDRVQISRGTKTKRGLIMCIEDVITNNEDEK